MNTADPEESAVGSGRIAGLQEVAARARGALGRGSALPAILSSVLSLGLLAGRVWWLHSETYIWLAWNLFLAWMPYLSSLWAGHLHRRFPGRWWLPLALGLLWLAFFPNAPYIVTDFWHLQPRPPAPMWFDIGMFSAFALTGLFLAVFSLRTMQRLVRYYAGSLVSWLFVVAVLSLGGLGIYMGRFLRLNSWDLLLKPGRVLSDVVVRLAHPLANAQTYGVSAVFAAILFVCYVALTWREPA